MSNQVYGVFPSSLVNFILWQNVHQGFVVLVQVHPNTKVTAEFDHYCKQAHPDDNSRLEGETSLGSGMLIKK